ncbi:hypothetical protein GCM10027447_10570 [Glycomyces halotolerans]
MNRTLRRVLGLTGSVVVGLAGAVTFASAAQAHHTTVTSTTTCAEDTWTVTWTVEDWNWKDYRGYAHIGAGWITDVTSSEPEVELEGDIEENVALPYPGETPLTATQTFSNDVDRVELTVDAVWSNDETGTGKGSANRPTDGCDEPEEAPEVWAVSDCFGLEVGVLNHYAETVDFTFSPSNGDAVVYPIEPAKETSYFFPVGESEKSLNVTVSVGDTELSTHEWEGGTNCEGSSVHSTCEGLEFELAVPSGSVGLSFTFTPPNGEEVFMVLAPGAEPETVTFDAPEGADSFVVTYVVSDGDEDYPGEQQWTKPEECDEAPPVEDTTPIAQEKLNETGSSLTIMLSTAAALVAAAAVLFFIVRRRRVAQDW